MIMSSVTICFPNVQIMWLCHRRWGCGLVESLRNTSLRSMSRSQRSNLDRLTSSKKLATLSLPAAASVCKILISFRYSSSCSPSGPSTVGGCGTADETDISSQLPALSASIMMTLEGQMSRSWSPRVRPSDNHRCLNQVRQKWVKHKNDGHLRISRWRKT